MPESQSVLEFFGLREEPFAATADPAYFYATQSHKECLYRVWNSVEQRHGIAVVLGNYGTGKTTLLRKLLTGMRADGSRFNTAVLASPMPSWTSFALLEGIVGQFGLRPARRTFASYIDALNEYLTAHRGAIHTLIIDDAQNLHKRGQLELLRLAQNLETPQHKLLNLVLFAQLEWRDVLRAAPNFLQRVNMTYTLEHLSADEIRRLIRFRIELAGGDAESPEFTEDALRYIYAFTEGSPRLTVTLCRNAMLAAAHARQRRITGEIVIQTIEKTTLADRASRARLAEAIRQNRGTGRKAAPAPVPVESSDLPPPGLGMSRDDRAREILLRSTRERH